MKDKKNDGTMTDINVTDLQPPPPTEQVPKYELFRLQQEEPLGDLWHMELPLSTNLQNLIKEAVIIPYANIQLPIVTAYALIPSALATVVPILYLYGLRGSGKSTIAVIISELHKTEVFSSATTFAAIRNTFNNQRWYNAVEHDGEKNTCLVVDNINKETLNNELLYAFFLNGYNRKTDTISIAKPGGENMTFKVFGTKVLSSVHPLYAQSKFSELNRRCMVVKCKPFEQMIDVEKSVEHLRRDFSLADKVKLEELDLSLLKQEFDNFWNDENNLVEYAVVKRQLSSRRKSFKLPDVITGARWTISVDLLTTGIVTKVWENMEDAIEGLVEYWRWYDDHVATEYGATHKLLEAFIAEETANAREYNKDLGYEAYPMEINPEKLKKHVAWAASQGMLEVTPTPTVIAEIMADIGWKLDKGSNGKICWIPSLK